ncbi:MAG: hypothetical protein AAFP78_13820, partial [Pseudomonadota bacterium]
RGRTHNSELVLRSRSLEPIRKTDLKINAAERLRMIRSDYGEAQFRTSRAISAERGGSSEDG